MKLNLILLLLLLLQGFSCQDEAKLGPSTELSEEMEDVREEIEDIIANRDCPNENDCRTIAFGSKPCGGPWEYLIYSAAQVDEAQLKELVERYNQLEDELNRREDRVSDCAMVLEPQVTCQNGVCEAEDLEK